MAGEEVESEVMMARCLGEEGGRQRLIRVDGAGLAPAESVAGGSENASRVPSLKMGTLGGPSRSSSSSPSPSPTLSTAPAAAAACSGAANRRAAIERADQPAMRERSCSAAALAPPCG